MNDWDSFLGFERLILNEYARIIPFSTQLSSQIEAIHRFERKFTGAGVQTDVVLRGDFHSLPAGNEAAVYGGVWLSEISFLDEIAITTIFFTNARLDLVEISCCGDRWPQGMLPDKFRIHSKLVG